MTTTYDFTGKVALVTGAATGIGRGCALAFARAGASVVVADVDAKRGQDTADTITAMGIESLFHAADLTEDASVGGLFDAISNRFGRLDFAHNNVGFGWGNGLVGTTKEGWDKTVALCMTAPFLCMQREIPIMQAGGGGIIVNTASMAALHYTPYASAPYVAAKAGVIAMSRYAAMAHAGDGIRVNAISPGLVATEAVAKYMTPEEQTAFAAKEQPIGRPVTVEEIAASVLWLCSDGAAMVTGENICVAGGQQAM